MKLTQTNDQLEIKTNGAGTLAFGIILILAGLAAAIFLPGMTNEDGSKTPNWVALIGIAIMVFGCIISFFAKNRKITIQKAGNTIITDKRLIGGKMQEQSVPTADIKAVNLYTYLDNSTDSDGRNNNTRRSTLSLILNNSDVIEIGNSGQGGFSFNGMSVGNLIFKAPLSKEAGQISSFLGLPLLADNTTTISGAVKSLKAALAQPSQEQPPTELSPNTHPTQPKQINPDNSLPPAQPPAYSQEKGPHQLP